MRRFARLLKRFWLFAEMLMHLAALLPYVLDPNRGRNYGIGLFAKLKLLWQLWRNSNQPGSSSTFFEHVFLASRLFEIPKEVAGSVAEFGCYKGFSSASLSLACALTGRRLVVFDSFQGLPEPRESVHNFESGLEVGYQQGQYSGTLEEVRRNVERSGDIGVCEFVPGYFDATLPERDPGERFVMIFEDADLPQSVRSVILGAWKKLQPGCTFFCHEARDREVVNLFFDERWWQETLGEPSPGFIGSGSGVMSGPSLDWCYLGFTVRRCGAFSNSETARGLRKEF
jgi:hypothetical protein